MTRNPRWQRRWTAQPDAGRPLGEGTPRYQDPGKWRAGGDGPGLELEPVSAQRLSSGSLIPGDTAIKSHLVPRAASLLPASRGPGVKRGGGSGPPCFLEPLPLRAGRGQGRPPGTSPRGLWWRPGLPKSTAFPDGGNGGRRIPGVLALPGFEREHATLNEPMDAAWGLRPACPVPSSCPDGDTEAACRPRRPVPGSSRGADPPGARVPERHRQRLGPDSVVTRRGPKPEAEPAQRPQNHRRVTEARMEKFTDFQKSEGRGFLGSRTPRPASPKRRCPE